MFFISLSLIFLLGISLGLIFEKLKLPKLIGMIFTGIILGPYALNLIDVQILSLSSELRKIALVIVLARAGLSLDIKDLKKVGRPAILMCFVPACFEIIGMIIVAPKLFNISLLDAAILGSVIAAVSPAVIVPKMIDLIEKGYGKEKSIPQLILAGASVDDVFVIVLFTSFLSMAQGEGASYTSILNVPLSIISGISVGLLLGYAFGILSKKLHIRDSIKVLLLLSIMFLMVSFEDAAKGILPFSGLIAIMFIGIGIQKKHIDLSTRLSSKFGKLWVGAEVLLFVLVGATVDVSYAVTAGLNAIILVFICLLFRMIGVFICMIKTDLNFKEKIFCMIGYMPKATVQAAIGGLPLAAGLSCGKMVLTISVLSILITAPLGAFLIDKTYKKLLDH